MTDPGTSSYTSDTSGGQCCSRVTLVFLLAVLGLLLLVRLFLVAVAAVARGIVTTTVTTSITRGIVPASVGVSKQATLIVTSRTMAIWARRRGIRTLRRGSMCGWVPLTATRRLVNVVPALTVLVPLGYPSRRHGWRCTVLEQVSDRLSKLESLQIVLRSNIPQTRSL